MMNENLKLTILLTMFSAISISLCFMLSNYHKRIGALQDKLDIVTTNIRSDSILLSNYQESLDSLIRSNPNCADTFISIMEYKDIK